MRVSAVLLSAVLCGCLTPSSAQDAITMSGYRLPNHFQYLALAPKVVRPDQTYNIFVTIYSVPYSRLVLRATLSRNGEEYASGNTIFTQRGTKNVQLLIPITSLPGEHKLTIEGLINDGYGAIGINGTGGTVASHYRRDGKPVFKNETMVHFHTKYTSLFVTTDRPVYFPPNTVYFRVLGVTPALDPVNGEMTIMVKDSNGVVVRRWLQKQLNFGTYADSFDIPYPVAVGNWSISVDAFGHIYEQQFLVKFFFQKRFDVIVQCPLFMFDTEWGFSCTVEGEHTSSRAIDGNATLSVKIREPDGTYMTGMLRKSLAYVTGVSPFEFSMNKIEELFGDVSGKEIVVIVELFEFWSMEAIEGTAVIKVKKDGVIIKALGKKFRAFKPNSPFEVVFVVQRSDGTPYEGFLNRQIAIQVFYEGGRPRNVPEEKLVVPDDSVVRYTVNPQDGDHKIIIRAWHVITTQKVEIECYRYWSENNKFISITTSTVHPRVNEYMVFTVRANFFVDEVNYLVMGQGNILLGSTFTMKKMQRTFALALSRAMAPAARVLVYCIVDGEILTDALNFHIQDKRLHQAELIINKGKDFKGDHVELIGKGVPGAFISFQGHDWEFYRRGAGTFINERRVIRELLTYNEGMSGTDFGDFGNDVDLPFQQIWYYPDDRWEGSVFFTAPTSGINHETTFNVSGLVALSDMNLTVTPESTPCNRTLGFGRCLSGACFELKYLCDGKIDCTEDGYDEMACPITDMTPPRPSELENLHLVATIFTPGEWLWHTTYVKYTGQTEMTVDVPDTDALFAISAYVVHPEEGLAIVDQPQQYDTTRQFFMTTEGPSQARRGEQIGVRCTVFNQWDQEIQVIMTLHGSDNYRFVVVEEFGIVRSYDPRTLTGDIQIMIWLPAMNSKYVHFPVLPTVENDDVEITISAFSILRTAVGKLTVSVSYDGVENDDQEPYLVDLVNQGSVIIPDFDIPVPERFFIPEQRWLLYVPGSNDAHVYVYGDVVSPGFFEDHLTCENTAKFPHDSADGYMYEFAVNLVTLRYLQTTNALTREAEFNALKYMKSIVARQYAYMMPNGAFRMFRRTEKPSIWLTSFVLHYFHMAQTSEWNEDLFIDMGALNNVAMWLGDQFNHTTRRYEETSTYVYDRDMLPESVDKNGDTHQWHIPLTAQVVITLAQAKRITGSAKGNADIVVGQACDYLASKLLQITSPFQMAIVAYALNVANHGLKEDAYALLKGMRREMTNSSSLCYSDQNICPWLKEDAYALLKGMRRETQFVYWSEEEVPPNDVQTVLNRQLMQPKADWYNTGHAVQATSYALLLYLSHNEFEASRPIMKWLQTQHNGFMAWSSSRDGLMALQALTAYAFRETNRDIYQMQLTIEATQPRTPTWRHTIHLNKTNFAKLHHFHLDRAWGEFRAYAQGTGYAYMHVTTLSKVEKPWSVQTPEFKNFELNLEEANFYGRNASHVNMTWCIKWVRPDLAPRSGMMFLAIDVPTGYVVARNVIEWMYVAGISGLKRVRYRNNMLYIFFESIGQQQTCFDYMMERWYPVANISIPHQAKVFEYTETGNQLNTMFESYTLFHLHICQVCGSFQCPYCPFYNTAPAGSASHALLALLVAAALVITQLRTSLLLNTGDT